MRNRKMKKNFLLLFLVILSTSIFSQQIKEQSQVINIEIPVRVFQGNTFVSDLTINDFEIYENGILQEVEAVYLVNKSSIERSEEKKRFAPSTSRNFFLFFELTEYSARVGDSIEYFVQNVIFPDDNLIIVTPLKTYRQTYNALLYNSKEELANQLKVLIRNDTTIGNAEYRSAMDDLTRLASSLSMENERESGNEQRREGMPTATGNEYSHFPFEKKLMRYSDIMGRIENLRVVDQEKLMSFSHYLKDMPGQKYVFLIYQREYIPQIQDMILNKYMQIYQDKPGVVQKLKSLSYAFKRDVSFNVTRVKQSFADSSISIHFLYLTTPAKHVPGLRMREQSEDIYSAFREIALSTGGFMESSANPIFLFNRAVEASENYYLLYYSPSNYLEDGKFNKITVRVKEKKYRIVHRSGYFAN
jgi:VWFA-related protein